MITSVIDRDLWTSLNNNFKDYSSSYDGALGFNLVKLRPNLKTWPSHRKNDDAAKAAIDKTITGIMINEFNYSMDSEWGTMETPIDSGLGSVIGGVGTMGGGGEMGYVYRSKKYWKKSGYLKVSPEIRIIDIDGTGLPLVVARTLLLWTVAYSIPENSFFKSTETRLKNAYNSLITENVQKIQKVQREDNGDSAFAESLVNGIANTAQAGVNFLEDIGDLFSLRQSPPPLHVDIGRIFSHSDMVLDSVSFKFSREFTDKGPLYIDATLDLSTRKMISNIDDTGLLGSVGHVQIVNSSKTPIESSLDAPAPPPLLAPTPPTIDPQKQKAGFVPVFRF